MQKENRIQHIDHVLALACDRPVAAVLDKEAFITQSWLRCVRQYRLDPTRPREARILPSTEMREHRERVEQFLRVARFGIEQLYRQVAGMGYVLLLTDRDGVTVDYIGDSSHDKDLRKAGLYLGADWNEAHAGTCGVGTCIATGQAFTCHQTDHFDATHIDLTCTVAPLYDPFGEPLAVLDISALHSPEPKASQYMALQLVQLYAQKIEKANFLDCFRQHWVMRLSAAPEFVEVDPDYLLAVDQGGRIIGFNRRMQQLLVPDGGRLLGRSIEDFFQCRVDELPRLLESADSRSRIRLVKGSQPALFVAVIAPKLPKPRVSPPTKPLAALAGLSGGDAVMERHIARAARLVDAGVNLLLSGETGVGKEYFAQTLHKASVRAARPFVAINCAALPESLIESELFGYAPGAFTGAHSKGRRGLIVEADGGTLFLDEIGDMPLGLQARLLRVLAQREVLPVGGSRPQPVNLYVMAATHRDLAALVAAGAFREDLYYRLNGCTLALPPLRQRGDMDFIIERVLREECAASGRVVQLQPAVRALLRAYRWPGNIRELRNVLRFAVAVCTGNVITPEDLPDSLQSAPPAALESATAVPESAERLLGVLRRQRWNVAAVARELGVARVTVYRRMEKYGIVVPNWRG